MNKKLKLKALIIGAGQAGSFRKEGNHAASFNQCPYTELMGIVDIDPVVRKTAAKFHNVNAFSNLTEALDLNPDIIAIAIHPEVRMEYWEKIWQSTSIKTIICEKPLANSVAEAEVITKKCNSLNMRLYVNYQRRANSTYTTLRDQIVSRSRGNLQSVIVHYTHGLQANACHWLDLGLMLFGGPNWILAEASPVPSPYSDDPNATILLGYDQFHLHLLPLISPKDGFCSGDMTLTFDKERIIVPDPTMYRTKHAKRWIETSNLLEEVTIDFSIETSENDFLPFLDLVMSDIKLNRASNITSNENIQLVKLIEYAKESIRTHSRMDLD